MTLTFSSGVSQSRSLPMPDDRENDEIDLDEVYYELGGEG